VVWPSLSRAGRLRREERYVRLIFEKGGREAILDSLDLDIESVGSELEDKDLEAIRVFASSLLSLYGEKERLEAYISTRMEETAPNLTSVVGASLGARLISIAGGLKRLSQLPAGTVQLLGAEKALFAHLKQGKRPPKHGVIFQHPTVHRGSIGNGGRSLAPWGKAGHRRPGRLLQGGVRGDRLNEDIAQRVEEIMKKYPEPPVKEKRPPRPGQSRGRGPHPRGVMGRDHRGPAPRGRKRY
jgi:nucleolar protein 56